MESDTRLDLPTTNPLKQLTIVIYNSWGQYYKASTIVIKTLESYLTIKYPILRL